MNIARELLVDHGRLAPYQCVFFQGNVADICMMDDGSFISGGKDDGALVIFNERYELIGAGAVLPKRF